MLKVDAIFSLLSVDGGKVLARRVLSARRECGTSEMLQDASKLASQTC